MDRFDRLLSRIEELSHSLSAFVYHYGVAEGLILGRAPPTVAISDFFHYCVAKGSKHIRAVLVLLENGFPEDAIVLTRAAYECYVSAAYARAQGEQAVDDLVYNTVGLNAKTVEYARTKVGGWNYRRLVDKGTGALYDKPPSIEKMIGSTGYPSDLLVHRHFYGFSSEHAHVNMIGSGNYRDGTTYTDRGNAHRKRATVLAAYVAVILLGVAVAETDMDKEEKARIVRELRASIRLIKNALAAQFNDATDDLVRGIRDRLEQVVR